MARPTGFPQPILDIADAEDRRAAAAAAAGGAALFYAFGNCCALAAAPDTETVRRMNRLKGRPLDQAGSVTTTPDRAARAFDWARLPRTLGRGVIEALMADFRSLGPIGFRGPAADGIPAGLTVDGTAQLIMPGDACPSNALVGDVLQRLREDFLFVASAGIGGMRAVQREFGHRPHIVLIGHRNERAVRRRYPHHQPCSTSILAFHREAAEGGRPALVLERLGSLDTECIRRVCARRGLGLVVAETARERVPVRRPRALALPRPVLSVR